MVKISTVKATLVIASFRRLFVTPKDRQQRYTSKAPLSMESEYKEAIAALNTLQSNASVLKEIRSRGRKDSEAEFANMGTYLARIGISVPELNSFNAIHVAGTKGKGSVCALCERILRAHGLKTGFYSSPHLLEVRERIRINGQPLSQAKFVHSFWECYNQLLRTKEEHEGKMPAYFRFLTILAMKVFLEEAVDVAVVEVGIGGAFDCTNVLERPRVCAITSIGYDHVDILGPSLSQIAWHKAGIIKAGCPVFTIEQEPEVRTVLEQRAESLGAAFLAIAPHPDSYPKPWRLSLAGSHQNWNASLAVQVCREWLKRHKESRKSKPVPVVETCRQWSNGHDHSEPPLVSTMTEYNVGSRRQIPVPLVTRCQPFSLPTTYQEALSTCCWMGRCQVIKKPGVTLYLDGGHTPRSLTACAKWFVEEAKKENFQCKTLRVLLFNLTGSRKPDVMLSELVGIEANYALFCPNVSFSGTKNSVDQTLVSSTASMALKRCYDNEATWQRLMSDRDSSCVTAVLPSVNDALVWVEGLSLSKKGSHIQLLLTGSLHLVGAALRTLGYTADDV